MKKLYIALFVILLLGCKSSSKHMLTETNNRYLLTDNNSDKDYLIDYINKLEKDSIITDKPLLVIEGFAISYDDLESHKLNLSKNEIKSIDHLNKNSEGAINIYGDKGKGGVLLIMSNRHSDYFGLDLKWLK